jgi:hypothetical protein
LTFATLKRKYRDRTGFGDRRAGYSVHYAYDPRGLQTHPRFGSALCRLWQTGGGEPLVLYKLAGSPVHRFYHSDHQGSIVALATITAMMNGRLREMHGEWLRHS